MSKQGMRQFNRGFTIIELMVVVAIIGIMAAVSIPALNRSLERAAAQDSATSIANMLRTARIQSMTTGTAVIATINRNDPNSFIQLRQATVNGQPARSCLQVTNATLAASPIRATLTSREINTNMNVVGMLATGSGDPASVTSTSLCFAPDGSIQTLGGVPVTTVADGVCNRGFFIVITRAQSLSQQERPFAGSGSTNLLCATGTTEKSQNELRLNREFNDTFLVEAFYNGFITVTQ